MIASPGGDVLEAEETGSRCGWGDRACWRPSSCEEDIAAYSVGQLDAELDEDAPSERVSGPLLYCYSRGRNRERPRDQRGSPSSSGTSSGGGRGGLRGLALFYECAHLGAMPRAFSPAAQAAQAAADAAAAN